MQESAKYFLLTFSAGFIFCALLLLVPSSDKAKRCETSSKDEISWIQQNLLTKQQLVTLSDYEEEGEYLNHTMQPNLYPWD